MFLSSTEVPQAASPFKDYSPTDLALYLVGRHGQTDGGHHKQWVLDQVARLLNGAPITVTCRQYDNTADEWDFDVGDCAQYRNWVRTQREFDAASGEFKYDYDEGIAP